MKKVSSPHYLKILIKSTKEGLNYSLKCDQKFENNQFTINSSFEVSENLLPTLYKFFLEQFSKNQQCRVCPFCDAKFNLFVETFECMATHATKLKQNGKIVLDNPSQGGILNRTIPSQGGILNRTNPSRGGILNRTNPSEGGILNQTKCSSDSSNDEVRPPAKKRKMIRMVSDSESDIEILEKSNDTIEILENSNDTEINFIGSIPKKDSGKPTTDLYSSESDSDSVYCFDERTLQVLNSTVIDSAESSDARTFFNKQAISNSVVQANPEGGILNRTKQIQGGILNRTNPSQGRILNQTYASEGGFLSRTNTSGGIEESPEVIEESPEVIEKTPERIEESPERVEESQGRSLNQTDPSHGEILNRTNPSEDGSVNQTNPIQGGSMSQTNTSEGGSLNRSNQPEGGSLKKPKDNIKPKTTKIKSKKCETCGKEFKTHRNLRQHKENIHEGKKLFSCGLCDKSFSQNKNLTIHITKVHEKKFEQCPRCNRKFGATHDLQKHIEIVHDKKKPFICVKCEKAFGAKLTLQRHTINCNRL